MTPGTFKVMPPDLPDVERTRQEPAEVRLWNRTAIPRQQPFPGEQRGHGAHRMPTGAVQLKRAAHERPVLRMNLNLVAATVRPFLEHIPARRSVGPASVEHLLTHALLHLGREIRGIELRERRHDVLDELSRDRIIDVFRDRRESHAASLQRGADGDMVLNVARHAVQFVHDHDIDFRRALLDPGEQSLKHRPVGGRRRGARFDKLLDHAPVLLTRVIAHRLQLGWNGQVLFSLLVRGDTGIDNAIHVMRVFGLMMRTGWCPRGNRAYRSCRTVTNAASGPFVETIGTSRQSYPQRRPKKNAWLVASQAVLHVVRYAPRPDVRTRRRPRE